MSPDHWPYRAEFVRQVDLPDTRAGVLLVSQIKDFQLWSKFSTFDHLLQVVAWSRRFAANARGCERKAIQQLTTMEMDSTRTLLLSISQKISYSSVLDTLSKGKGMPLSNPLFSLHPLLGDDGLIHVGDRLQQSSLDSSSIHPIVLDHRSPIVKLILCQLHHAGPSTMMALLAEINFIPGAKKLCKSISRSGVTC